MRVPELLFELVETSGQLRLTACYFRNDYVGVEQDSPLNQDGAALVRPGLLCEHQRFAHLWDRNLRAQGFAKACQRTKAAAASRP